MRPPSPTNLDAPRSLADLLPRSISRTSPQAQCFQCPKYFTVGGFRAQTQYWYPSITWRSAEAGDRPDASRVCPAVLPPPPECPPPSAIDRACALHSPSPAGGPSLPRL